MFFLGLDFIISSLVWLLAIGIFVFAFRKQIKKFFYKQTSFDIFITELKKYLAKTYPKVNFSFDIIEKSKSEPNPDARKYIILDNIIDQFMKLELDSSKYPQATPLNLQWSSYVFNCEPNRNKLPSDWQKRKQALLQRDNNLCFRCSRKLNTSTASIYMLRSLEQNGKYNLENLVPVCKDCEKILNKDSKKLGHLNIKDELYQLVEN